MPSPDFLDVERMHEECGVFGVYRPGGDVAAITCFGLYALQHRGQESAGIATGGKDGLQVRRGMGLVSQVFDQATIDSLSGEMAIGHTRYSTTGVPNLANAQPMRFVHPELGEFMVAHNGNLTNAHELRQELLQRGTEFVSGSDTEVIGQMIAATAGRDCATVLLQALPRMHGAYCLVLLSRDSLVAARDPLGIRPLCLGRMDGAHADAGAGYVIASETCALDVVGAVPVREVDAGEIIVINSGGVERHVLPDPPAQRAMCSFEFIYFARPDSVMNGRSLYEARRSMGRELAQEAPVGADVVITLPDSGTPAAIGYAEESGTPFVEGMIKSRYITRTFIEPSVRLRESGIRLKFNPMPHILAGKRVVLVDDSIVRGTTSRRIVEELRRAGAAEVHMRIASPPIMWPCFMGIDIASRNELIAADKSPGEIGAILGCDSLHYLSIEGLRRAVGQPSGAGFCFACFNGQYPVDVRGRLAADKSALELPVD